MVTRNQRITWTGLPNGIYMDSHRKKFLRVSVHIAPRLYSTAAQEQLSNYGDFLDWPNLVKSMHFQVTFSNGGSSKTLAAQLDPSPLNGKPRPQPDSTVYKALFLPATPVNPYHFSDFTNRFIISHPASQLLNFLQNSYQFVGTLTSDGRPGLPSIYTIARQLNPTFQGTDATAGPFDFNDSSFKQGQYIKSLKGKYGQQGAVSTKFTALPPGQIPTAAVTMDQFQKVRFFHYRDGTKQNRTLPGQVPQQTEPDFHQALSAFTKHPTLERYLGIVIDLIVPMDPAIPRTSNPYLQVSTNWVSTTYPGAANAPIRPKTHYTFDGTNFFATPADVDLDGRWLNLPNSAFTLSQIDVDGGALKLSNFIATTSQSIFMRGRFFETTEAIPSTAGLPTIRTAGFQLLKQDRALDLATTFKQHKAKNQQADNRAAPPASWTDPDMYAEDVTLGYRPDIFNTITNKWHSLVRREGTYSLQRSGQTLVIDEEGFISLGVTEDPADSGANRPFYMHEGIFRWTGWSLAVPLPGAPAKTGDNPAPPDPGIDATYKLSIDWTNGGTFSSYKKLLLPRLRFGKGYRVRARAVDLAGNSLDPTINDGSHAIPAAPVPFYRWEPVASPPVALAQDVSKSPGENLERLVIRSDYGVNAPNYPAAVAGYGLTYYGTGATDTIDFLPTSARHVYPPKSSEEMSERHGKFDDPNAAAAVKVIVNDYDNIGGSGKGIATLDGALPQDGITGQGSVVPFTGNENSINIGYLPDVLARGAAFASLPGDPPVNINNPSGYPQPFLTFDHWPFVKPFLLRLNGLLHSDPIANPTPPTQGHAWDPNKRVLDVYLAQAETWTMQLSSFFNAADLNLFGVWKWLTDYFNVIFGDVPNDVHNQALYGLFWMLSPFREITLIHPVQRPLVIPKWATLRAVKQTVGQTWADLWNSDFSNPGIIHYPNVPVHGKSTIKLDVYGDWMMPIDSGTGDPSTGFHTITSHDHVVNIPVQPTDTGVPFGPMFDAQQNDISRQHKFHDTKYRLVSYTAVATTRFKEYFGFTDADIANNPKASITQTSPAELVHVQNSRRPDAPSVRYVIPAFRWDPTKSVGTDTLESDRHGGWIRVWLDRPWYSTGDGEQLGVIVMALHDPSTKAARKLADSTSAAARIARALNVGPKLVTVPENLKSYVTQWGTDMTRLGATMAGSPVADAFPHASFISPDTPAGSDPHNFSNVRFDNLSISEVAGASVAVAPHDVHFDPNRQLWYCDIQMTLPGAGHQYYPFVRMALARFQPRSIEDAHLSKIIQADFVQLAPDRFASVSYQYGGNPRSVHVAVTGPAYASAIGAGPGTTMEVILEQQQANAEGDLAWVPVPHAVYQMAGRFLGINDPYNYVWQTGINGVPDVTLPRPQGQVPYRLIIKEYESFRGEPTDGVSPNATVQEGNIVQRVVYVASIDI